MSFEIFKDHEVKEEVYKMIYALRLGADFAVSDLEREDIQKYASELDYPFKLHKLKSGKIKVRLTPPTKSERTGV